MLYGSDITVKILVIDSHGQPVRWALMQRAARYYAAGKVVTELGENLFGMAGGVQEATGERSEFVTSSIVMISGRHRIPFGHAHVGLTKHRLFVRDRQVCAYCANRFAETDLTVEHTCRCRVAGATNGLTLSPRAAMQHAQGQSSPGRSEHAA
jgi:hypothetical protein